MKSRIKTELPFCFYRLDDRTLILGDRFNTTIRFIKQKIEPSRRTGQSINMEFVRDRWGTDACSLVEVETDKNFSDYGTDSTDKAKQFVLNVINRIIELYRHFDREAVHLDKLIKEDLWKFDLVGPDSSLHTLSIGFGGGMVLTDQNLIQSISSQLQGAIDSNYEIPFWQEILCDANHCYFIGDNRKTVLESVIALESVLSKLVRYRGGELGINVDDIGKYVRAVGVRGMLVVSLKFIIGNQGGVDMETVGKCTDAIALRNKIVHGGELKINQKQAGDALSAAQKMIDTILNSGRCTSNSVTDSISAGATMRLAGSSTMRLFPTLNAGIWPAVRWPVL